MEGEVWIEEEIQLSLREQFNLFESWKLESANEVWWTNGNAIYSKM